MNKFQKILLVLMIIMALILGFFQKFISSIWVRSIDVGLVIAMVIWTMLFFVSKKEKK
jgi:hypothetical protein